MALYLVRHAPTAANVGHVFMGQQDVPALAVEHPERYRVPLVRPRVVYTSPLSRALSAVDVLFPDEAAVPDNRLLERAGGVWEGLAQATIRERWPDSYVDGSLNPRAIPSDGESLEDLQGRVSAFLDWLPTPGPEADVYAVTHNGWIRVALWLRGDFTTEHLFTESVPFLTPIRYR